MQILGDLPYFHVQCIPLFLPSSNITSSIINTASYRRKIHVPIAPCICYTALLSKSIAGCNATFVMLLKYPFFIWAWRVNAIWIINDLVRIALYVAVGVYGTIVNNAQGVLREQCRNWVNAIAASSELVVSVINQTFKSIQYVTMFSSSTTWGRSTMHPKFDPTGVRTHDLRIITVHFMSLRLASKQHASKIGVMIKDIGGSSTT